ncbi:hypothetical protein RI103_34995 [Paraburkholderia sp. FT54]|uniref:hypothetical protein n=1 Tax=Paraburkholderia sp. FT54 TaxID=3074437 RepID=UPI0028772721|nr:hypothetical protein [Paraburkholderia sp. FT54]WNC94382.1 hypothetical protein RI103_34995 [Paraburkholderia sp. FT54]
MNEEDSPIAQGNVDLPSAEDFCLSVPIYETFPFDKDQTTPFFAIEHYSGTLDCFCEGCGRHTVFNRIGKADYREHHHSQNYIFSLWFVCSRNNAHRSMFFFRSHQGVLQKIGQYPSMADLDTPDLQKYRTVLGKERFRELTRGVGLASHGVGIGAFVYLRRVFESLIEEAKPEASQQHGWDDSAFAAARMDGKIQMLKQILPRFLVENRNLYGILSVGVHTLSEQECLDAFPAVKLAIELILDEMLEKSNREKKLAEAKKSLSSLGAVIKKPSGA